MGRRTARNSLAVFSRRAEVLCELADYRDAFSSFVDVLGAIWAFDALRRHCVKLAVIDASNAASQ